MPNIIQYDSNFLVTDSTLKNVVWVTYGTTTYAQVLAYVNAGQVPCVERNGMKYILSSTDTNYGLHTFSAEGYTIKLWNSINGQDNLWDDATQQLAKCSDLNAVPVVLNVTDYFSYNSNTKTWSCIAVPPLVDLIVTQGKGVLLKYGPNPEKFFMLSYRDRVIDAGNNPAGYTFIFTRVQSDVSPSSNYGDVDTIKIMTDYPTNVVSSWTMSYVSFRAASAPITTTSNNSNVAWCIKLTRLSKSARGYVRVTVDLSRYTNADDFGFVDICVKTHNNDWHALAIPYVRRNEAKQFGQCKYLSEDFNNVGGVCYIGIQCSSYNTQVLPNITGNYMNGQFSVEVGDFFSAASSSSAATQLIDTRFPVYAKYNNNDMYAMGSPSIPVYVNAEGRITPCDESLPINLSKTADYTLYGDTAFPNDYTVVNIVNPTSNTIKIYLTSSTTSDYTSIGAYKFCSFMKLGNRWYQEY